jgi:predicted ATPase/class 3 adenylate cyclase
MAEGLPGGSVSFVFTDIEGSTRLLRRLGDDYVVLLEQHRAVLRGAWGACGGVEVGTEGDGSFVAFATAGDALTGCVDADRALRRARWPPNGEPRVRFGVHSGIAFPRDGGYIALAVHQAARVVSAAHGGQIILSEQTARAVGSAVPSDVQLASLGRFRLRDFDEPVELFQARGSDLQDGFPAVRAIPADRHNIVPAATSFIGRHAEFDWITTRVAPGRAISVVGGGGMGKTRLASEVGRAVADQWPDGVWMVDLSTVLEPRLVIPAIAETCGVPDDEAAGREHLTAALARRQMLLILDNCEQIVDECATVVRDILARCPAVGILVTSRAPLNISGENVYRLTPLAVVDEAVELFVARAMAARSRGLDDFDRDVVAAICARLDGLPLAIELAASRCTVLSLQEIYKGLDERFRVLRAQTRGTPERQRTMTALLDWSYDLLGPDERAAFMRLSIFGGSFTLSTATAAVGHSGVDPYDVAELVWSLVDKSLAGAEPAANETRYRMLETVHAYAAQRLAATGDGAPTAAALADWYLDRFPLAQRGNRHWLTTLTPELDTIGALLQTPGLDPSTVHALARLRVEPLIVSGNAQAAIDEVERVLQRFPQLTPGKTRLVLLTAGLLGDMGRLENALARCEEGEALIDPGGDMDRWGSLRAASPKAVLLLRSPDPARLAEAEVVARAQVAAATTTAERADALLRLGLAVSMRGGDVADLYREVVALAHEVGDHVLLALTLNNLVEILLRRGALTEAAEHQREAIRFSVELGMDHITAFGLIATARIAESLGHDAVAVRLYANAETRLADTGIRMFPDDEEVSAAALERAARRLGPDRYQSERTAGATLTTEEALTSAESLLNTVC